MRFGDLDRDGTLDQAVANAGSNDVWCWWGEDGTFGPPVSYPVGRGPYAVTLGDLDGNRAADLAVANNFSGDVSVLLQDGPPSGDGASGVPSCDPLVEACVPAAAEEEAPPAAASGGAGGGRARR